MKRVLLASAAFAALTVSVPASAQVGDILRQGIENILGGGNDYRGGTTERQLIQLNTSIQAGYQRGDISQSEATRLQNELRSIAERERAYRSGGLSRDESDDLQRRIQAVENRIQQASYGRDGRYDDRDGRYDDRDRDGRYDDRDRDSRWNDDDRRDGRWNDGDRRDGRGWCPPGLERKDNGCQPPGQAKKGDRWSNHHGQAASGYGQRYRDTNRYLFRYHEGRIYQIDRRTSRIVAVTNAPRRR